MKIIKSECKEQFAAYKQCLADNNGDESKCVGVKDAMLECGVDAFRRVNKTADYDI